MSLKQQRELLRTWLNSRKVVYCEPLKDIDFAKDIDDGLKLLDDVDGALSEATKQIQENPCVQLECQIEIGMRNARRNWKRSKKKGNNNVTDDDFKRIVSTRWIPLNCVLSVLGVDGKEKEKPT